MPNMGGDAHQGQALIVHYGCGACHVIPGIYTARGLVGPPLYFYGRRTMIAGELPNSTDNLIRWLRNPPAVEPGTAMPNLDLNQQQARDIAAYLDSLQ
ncbi:MAG: c-type cytochrome [Acidobacteriaceae bacterium]